MIIGGTDHQKWPLWVRFREEQVVLDALSVRRWRGPFGVYRHIAHNTEFHVPVGTVADLLEQFVEHRYANRKWDKGHSLYRITEKGCNVLHQYEIRNRGPLVTIKDLSISRNRLFI